MAAAAAEDVKTALSDLLKLDETDMPSYWGGVCSRAAAYAYQVCRDALLSRGFLPEHVAAWDRLEEFTLDVALWKALNAGGAYDAVPKETLEGFDRREELEEVLVFVGDEWIKPTGDRPGTAASAGPTVAQTGGVFRWDDGPDAGPDYGIQI